MKPLALALLIIILSSCLVGRWTLHVPGGKYVTTLRLFE
jgi:hypothetical protein